MCASISKPHPECPTAIDSVFLQCNETLRRLPQNFDLPKIFVKFPVIQEISVNLVLQHEVVHYNSLLEIIRKSLNELKLAIKGDISMTRKCEECYVAILNGKLPVEWMVVSYPSLKSFPSYFSDLLQRLKFFQNWIDRSSQERIYWFSAFFFPHSWISAILQNFARNRRVNVDDVELKLEVTEYEVDEKVQAMEFLKVNQC